MMATAGVFPVEEFHVLGAIGRGEFGKVHRATWAGPDTDSRSHRGSGTSTVALKHVESSQGEAKLRAEQEGVRLQELVWQQYPDIVPRVYRDGTAANGDYYIAMEFVRGESLHDILRRKRLTSDEAVRLASIVASVLQRLHAFHPPILHSDLKPEHVLVLDDGTVRIIDFGIAKRPATGAATHNAFLSVMYAAPERVEDEARNVHPSDDLWALGIMFFEMLAGRHPREDYRASIEEAIRRDDLAAVATLLRERPGTLPPDCSPQLDAIVRKMLAPQPGHRYAMAALVLADLENYVNGRETVAWRQLVAAGRATRVVTRPKTDGAGTPTLPVPPPLPRTGATVSSGPPQPSDPPRIPPIPVPATGRPRRRLISRRGAGVLFRAFAAVLIARVLIGEGVAWSRAERFRERLASFDVQDLPSIPPMVSSLGRGALFGFAASGVNGPLSARMLELAEPTIADYRQDFPSAKLPQWKAAAAALAIAAGVQPQSREVRSRARYVDGHLLRIEAQGRPTEAARPILTRAVAAFHDAARLDDEWPDPYVALAAIHAYGLRDVDAVVEDINQATRRGFSGGRREHAEVADAFSYRADQSRTSAARANDDDRIALLQSAATDYQSCIEHYSGVAGYYNSDRNSERCQRLLDMVTGQLNTLEPTQP